jgi:hypothetical protein
MKLAPRRYGHFKVAAKISDVAYRLQLPDTWKIHDVFHVSLLMPYKEMEKHGPNFLEPPPELIEGEPKWEVEQILGDRTYWHKKQFLIRWKGYVPAHDSWVDESDINAPDLLMDYKKRIVSKVLSQLNQSAAQSSRPKRQQKMRIRTIEVDNEESFPHPLPSSACSNPHNPLVATLVSTAPTGATTPLTDSSTNSYISHISTSALCATDDFTVALPLDSILANSTNLALLPLDVSEARSPIPSMSDISNHSLTTNNDDKSSYYSPAVHNKHTLPGPGFTCPVTPDHLSVVSSTNNSDKENYDPDDDPYSPQGLAFTWSHARATVKHWREHKEWLPELSHLSSDIFWTAYLSSAPAHSNDINTHDDTNYACLHGALKAYREELAPYVIEHELVPVAEDEEDGRAEEEERGRIILEEIGIPGPLSNSPEQSDNGQVVDKDDDRMRAYGWVRYDPFSKESTWVDYEEGGVRHTCKWIRYHIRSPNPQVEGCQGPATKIYSRDLHANPCAAPNFTEPRFFRDDSLQIFHPTHTSRNLVDRAVADLHDPGLEADILHFRHYMGECNRLA